MNEECLLCVLRDLILLRNLSLVLDKAVSSSEDWVGEASLWDFSGAKDGCGCLAYYLEELAMNFICGNLG